MEITVTAEKGTHVAVPGRYAHVARRPVTTYETEVTGSKITNRNLSTLKSVVRAKLYRSGVTEKITFVIEEVSK